MATPVTPTKKFAPAPSPAAPDQVVSAPAGPLEPAITKREPVVQPNAIVPEQAADTVRKPVSISASRVGKSDALPAAPAPREKTSARHATPTEAPEALPSPEEPLPLRGVEHSPADRHRVNLLGGSLVALALFGAIPCVVEVYRVWDADTPTRIGLWFWPTLLLSTVQLAFARYLTQLPDWSSTWITALMSLAAAALYSMLLGAVLIAKPASPLNDLLPLLERGNEVKGWCLIMVSLSSLLTYLSGRLSVRWHRNYQRWVESLAPGDSA